MKEEVIYMSCVPLNMYTKVLDHNWEKAINNFKNHINMKQRKDNIRT